MPFVSKSQQRYMFSQMPKVAERFAKHTPNIKKLPEKVAVMSALKKRVKK
jgi:hypothetical protein